MTPNLKMSKKALATKLTNAREVTLAKFLSGEDVPLTCFPCAPSLLVALRDSLQSTYHYKECKKIGGMGKHYDGILVCDDTLVHTYELKHSEKKIEESVIFWRPWEGGVQFANSQFKSQTAKTFLQADLMYETWFKNHVQPFLTRHPELGAKDLSYDDYFRTSTSTDAHKESKTLGGDLMRNLRESKSLQKELQKEWLGFEETWMPAHPLNHEVFEGFVRCVIEQKDVWININKRCAKHTEGFLVKGVTYEGVVPKKHGGVVYEYRMQLQKKSGGEIHTSKIQFKFTWKNGGQAIQNLNFIVVGA